MIPSVYHVPRLCHLAAGDFHEIDFPVLLLVEGDVEVSHDDVRPGTQQSAAVLVSLVVHSVYEGLNLHRERRKTKHHKVKPLARVIVDPDDPTSLLRRVVAHALEQSLVRDVEQGHIVEDGICNVVCKAGLLKKLSN